MFEQRADPDAGKNDAGMAPKTLGHAGLAGEFSRFVMVGVVNTATCLALLYLLHDLGGTPIWIASPAAYAVAAVQSFLINRKWTFSGQQQHAPWQQALTFAVVNVVGGAIFTMLVAMLVQWFISPVAGLFSIAVTTMFNFLALRQFAFKRIPR